MLLTLLGLIPGLLTTVNSYLAKRVDAQVEMYKAKTGADEATARNVIAAANVENANNTDKLRVIASNPWLTFLFVFMAIPVALYEWKAMIIDKIVCVWIFSDTCNTDALHGDLSTWANIIIGGVFGFGTAQTIAKHWFSRGDK